VITAGDFNGDGRADLAIGGQNGVLTVLLGNGDGTFTTAPASAASGSNPTSIAVGDFNGDGKADLVLANDYSTVTVLLGKGDGTFTSGVSPQDSHGPDSVAVADFNGDGKADIAIGNNNDNTATILLGNGDGTFTAVNPAQANGGYAFAVAVGDFNGDGKADLAVTNGYSATVNVLLGNGDGTFTYSGASPSTDYGPMSVADFNNDGVPDLAVNASGNTNSSTLLLTQLMEWTTATADGISAGPGQHLIQASYPGDSNYSPSVSSTTPLVTSSSSAAAPPVITLPSGKYSGPQTVIITDATPNATIYYTINGSSPTASSAVYTGPLTVSSSETLVAAATATGYSTSAAASAQYLIGSSSTPFIYTVAGNGTEGYGGDGGLATAANLNGTAYVNYSQGVVVDSAGNLYFADVANNRIRKVAAGTGIITTAAGNGTAGYTGDGGAATSAELNDPQGVALDGAGNLYIADFNNDAIREVAAATGVITTIAGNGAGVPLSGLSGLAFDAAGNLYIADSAENVIIKLDAKTKSMSIVAGDLTYNSGYSGDYGPATFARLDSPTGVAFDAAGNLYIADNLNNVIRKVSASNGVITTVAGNGYGAGTYSGGYSGDGGPATSAELNSPQAVALDSTGNLYIADKFNNVVREVSANQFISSVVGNGTAGCLYAGNFGYGGSGDGGPATSAELCYPGGIAFDNTGNLYITDSSGFRVRKVTVSAPPPTVQAAAPVFSVSAGTYSSPQSVTISDTTPGAAIYLTMSGNTPTSASAGYNGSINVSGTVTINAIAIAPGYLQSSVATAAYTISSSPVAVIKTIVGDGVFGFSGAGGAATSVELGTAYGVAFDKSGDLFITDGANNVVWEVAAKTGLISIAVGNGKAGYSGDNGPATNAELNAPFGIALDGAGNLYIADQNNNVIRKVTASTGLITTIAGNGQHGYSGDGGAATSAELAYPQGIVIDSAGNLYVADTYNGSVRKITVSTGIITTAAGNGTVGYTGDGGAATSASLSSPNAVTFDSADNLYIADSNGTIRKVTASTGIITTVAGNGDAGYSGDGGKATSAEINPYGLVLDSAGNLYFSSDLGAIRKVSASTGIVTTIAGNGFCEYGGDGGSATVAGICNPNGIALDAAGNLYIADTNNYRVREVTYPSAPTVTVIPSASSITTTQSVTVTVTVNGGSGNPTPTGSVALTSGSYTSAATDLSGGSATISIPAGSLSVGSDTLSAAYTPDSSSFSIYKDTSGTASSPVTVSVATPTVTVTPGSTSITTTQALTVTVAVSGGSGNPTATGTMKLSSGSYTSAATSLSGGSATVSIPAGSLAVGSDTLSAAYTPDSSSSSIYAGATGTASVTVTQANPVPVVNSLSPALISAGSAAFLLTINGSGFAATSTVYWGTTALSTQYVSATHLTAQVTASQIATAGITAITVQAPAPGGGTSNSMQFEVDSAGSGTPPTFTTLTATVTPGSTATYSVTLPSSATNVSVTCLNLPSGASCSYSTTTNSVTITTSSTTPAGTYQITVVFTETLPGPATAFILLPILFLPLLLLRRKLFARGIWLTACMGLVLMAALAFNTGCGGGGGGTTPPQTHQATSSATVTLTVQ
jgi:sugar lactone lactonase YvrE